MDSITSSLSFDEFWHPSAPCSTESHQNHQKVKIVRKKRSHFGAILGYFHSKNECKKRLRFGIDFQWIWVDFWLHFGAILIHFRFDFLLWRTMRFRWPFRAKSMFWGAETHEKIGRIASNFDVSSRPSFCKEIHSNLVKNGPEIDPNSIKNWFEKSMHFWTTQDRCVGEFGGRCWGSGALAHCSLSWANLPTEILGAEAGGPFLRWVPTWSFLLRSNDIHKNYYKLDLCLEKEPR